LDVIETSESRLLRDRYSVIAVSGGVATRGVPGIDKSVDAARMSACATLAEIAFQDEKDVVPNLRRLHSDRFLSHFFELTRQGVFALKP
jgi:hypothetical protein